MNHHQLGGYRGPVGTPAPARLIATAVLMICLGLGYGVWKLVQSRHSPLATNSPSTGDAMPRQDRLQDAENHLRHVQKLLVAIEQKQKVIHKKLQEVSPVIRQNYLDLEQRRIDVADQITNSVLRDTGEALDEIELTKENLSGGHHLWDSK